MRCYLTSKAARLVYIAMIIPLLTSSWTLKSPYNNTQKLKYNSLDKRAWKILKLNVPSIENLANRERVLLVKSCAYAKNQIKSLTIISNCLNISINPEVTRKA